MPAVVCQADHGTTQEDSHVPPLFPAAHGNSDWELLLCFLVAQYAAGRCRSVAHYSQVITSTIGGGIQQSQIGNFSSSEIVGKIKRNSLPRSGIEVRALVLENISQSNVSLGRTPVRSEGRRLCVQWSNRICNGMPCLQLNTPVRREG